MSKKYMGIRKKLLIGFLVVAICTGIVGTAGIIGMRRLNTKTQQINTYVDNTNNVAKILDNLQQQRIYYREAALDMLIDKPEAMEQAISDMEELAAEMEALAETLSRNISDPLVTDRWASTMIIYTEEYVPLRDQLIQAARASDQGEVEQLLNALGEPVGRILENVEYLNQFGIDKADITTDAASAESSAFSIFMIVISVVVVAGAILLGRGLASKIARPVMKMVEAAQKLSEGDINVDVHVDTNDEINELGTAFSSMIDAISEQSQILQTVAGGNYNVHVPIRSESDVMNQSIDRLTKSSTEMMLEMRDASTQVAAGASQIAQSSQNLASGSSEQAASVEEFSATLAELKAKTDQNAEHSETVREVSDKTGALMVESARSMQQVLGAMEEIDASSNNINRIIKVIDDIAFQTNILALNAAVEAARAGQHGKGFAVVADEVRNLASKSANAARETAVLIEGSTSKVQEGSALVKKANDQINEVESLSGQAMELVQKMVSANIEQARSIAELDAGLDQISSVVQANSATAEESAASAEEMAAQANILNNLVSRVNLREGRGMDLSSLSATPETGTDDPLPDKVIPLYSSSFTVSSDKY